MLNLYRKMVAIIVKKGLPARQPHQPPDEYAALVSRQLPAGDTANPSGRQRRLRPQTIQFSGHSGAKTEPLQLETNPLKQKSSLHPYFHC